MIATRSILNFPVSFEFMSSNQIKFGKQIKFSPTGTAMTIFGVVLGVLLILPILLLLFIAGVVAMFVYCVLSVYGRIVIFFQGFTKKDSEGRKNVRIRKPPTNQQ